MATGEVVGRLSGEDADMDGRLSEHAGDEQRLALLLLPTTLSIIIASNGLDEVSWLKTETPRCTQEEHSHKHSRSTDILS